MASLVKTLTHKASRGRLRKQSDASNATPPPPVPTAPPSYSSPSSAMSADSPSANLSPSVAFSPVSSLSTSPTTPATPSLRFWRKREPSPAPEKSSHRLTGPPKPILRRRDGMEASPSPRPASSARLPSYSAGYSPQGSERQLGTSPTSSSRDHSSPPSAFRPAATSPPTYALPTPPKANRPPMLRLSSAPTGTRWPEGGLSPTTSLFNYTAQTPTFGPGMATSVSSAPPAARSSTYSAHRVSSYSQRSTRSSNYRVSPPGSATGLSATASSGGHSPTSASGRPNSRQSMRSSRPGSSASGSYPRGAAPSNPLRPSSVLSNNGSTRRRSSRPAAPSGSRTRASISISPTFQPPSPSNGSMCMSPGPISPMSAGHSPVSPMAPLTPLGAAFAIPSAPPLSPATLGRQAFGGASPLATVPQSPDVNDSAPSTPDLNRWDSPAGNDLASPSLASTPGGVCPTPFRTPTPRRTRSDAGTSTPPRRANTTPRRKLTEDGSPLPMLNLIPATPQDVVERPPSAPAVEDEERKPVARVLFEEWGKTSPHLDDVALGPGSPIQLNVMQLDDLESDSSDNETDDSDDRTADAHEEDSEYNAIALALLARERQAAAAKAKTLATPMPPPKPAKSPARKLTGTDKGKSLYEAHDDGRSISHSLAELAALACDLPPLGEELTQTAAAASQRLAAARAAVDSTVPTTPPRVRRVPVPQVTEPMTPPQSEGSSEPCTPASVPRSLPACGRPVCAAPCEPLPPSPEFMSYGSLPSLVSHDSVPSNMSHDPESLTHMSHIGTASPDAEEAMAHMLHTLSSSTSGPFSLNFSQYMTQTTPKGMSADLAPENPGLGLGLDQVDLASFPYFDSPATGSRGEAENLASPVFKTPASPNTRQIHRMSAAAAHPHRVALYGTPRLFRRSVDSAISASTATTAASPRDSMHHVSHSSVSSMSMASDISDDDVLNAAIMNVTPFSGPYVVRREEAYSQEVGIAY